MEGGGKMYGNHDMKLLKGFSLMEPRKFGLGLVAGFLLVTFAYFFTAKFDPIHIAIMSSPSENAAAAISSSSLVQTGDRSQQFDLGVQNASQEGSKDEVFVKDDENISSVGATNTSQQLDLGVRNAPLEDNKDEVFVKDDANVSSMPSLPHPSSQESTNPTQQLDLGVQNGTLEGNKDEVFVNDGDADIPSVASEESTNTTQQLGILEDEELQVQDVTPPPKNSSSIVVPSDPVPVPVPVPVQQISPPEVKQPETRREDLKPAEWKPLCDRTSNFRIDWCELEGDVRIVGRNTSIMLVASPESDNRNFRVETWHIKPYPRKADKAAMGNVREVTVKSLASSEDAPQCTDTHDVPALVFSDRGYTGNYFHAYTDVILPLFLTARQYGGEVQFLVADFQMWWLGKFLPVFQNLSRYDMIDLDNDDRVRCYPRVQVGLTSHDDFSIDPRRAPNGYSMVDFAKFLRTTYGLPKDTATGIGAPPYRKPRLLIIARAHSRKFVNVKEIIRDAEKVGFEVVVSEGQNDVAQFAQVVNTCDAVMGVHGAGLTNMVFLPVHAVVIQVVPLGGLEFVAGYFRGPSRDLNLHYIEYRITPEESTLIDQYPRDHAVFTDPASIRAKGWVSLKEAFLDKQDVKLDMRRFRPVLKKALGYLRKNQ